MRNDNEHNQGNRIHNDDDDDENDDGMGHDIAADHNGYDTHAHPPRLLPPTTRIHTDTHTESSVVATASTDPHTNTCAGFVLRSLATP